VCLGFSGGSELRARKDAKAMMSDRWDEIAKVGARPDPLDDVWFKAFANCSAAACLFVA
jgi:hypothetical protein